MSPAPGPRLEQARLEQALAPLGRRSFLKLTAGALAGILPAGLENCGDRIRRRSGVPEDVDPVFFSPRTYAVLNQVTMRMVGARGARLISAGRVDPAATADAWLADLGAVAEPFQTGLWVLEYGIWPLLAKWHPFTALAPADQDEVLVDLMRSRLAAKRQLFGALKTFGCLAFYADARTRGLTGYPGPWGGRGIRLGDAMIRA